MVQDEHDPCRPGRQERKGAKDAKGAKDDFPIVRTLSWALSAFLAAAALLTAIGPGVAWRFMPEHPGRAAIAPDAADPRETIARLESLDPIDDDRLSEAALLISGAIVDHWPVDDEVDPAVATTLLEHPPRWLAIQIGGALPDSLSGLMPNHRERMRIERREWRSAVMLGVGSDGQRALALARFLREKGVDAWPAVDSGRAVCVVEGPDGARALDPARGGFQEIGVAVPYRDSTTLLSRRGRVGWTLALGALAFFAWGGATARVDPRWSVTVFVLAFLEIAHQTGVAILWWTAVVGALGVLAWALRTGRLRLGFLRPAALLTSRIGRAAARSPHLRNCTALACRGGGVLLGCVAVASTVAMLLLALGPSLADRFLRTHPLRAESGECKSGLDCIEADEAIARLEKLDLTTEEGLVEANRIFAAAMLHHWPREDERAPPTAVRFYEDLPFWLEKRKARALGDRDAWTSLAWRERGRWRSALRVGVGFCSQHAIAISDYLREKGVEARPYGLDGHVVARVQAPGGEWVLDPDYAVVLRRSVEEAGADFDGTMQAYIDAGVEPSIAALVAETFGPEGNTEYTITFVGADPSRAAAWQRRAFTMLAVSAVAAIVLWWAAAALRRIERPGIQSA